MSVSRRSVVKGAAWSVPTVAVVSAAPAMAASPACTPENQKAIVTAFTTYENSLPDYTGVIIRTKIDQTLLAVDGTVQIAYISFWNVGTKTVDFTTEPFNVQVDIVRDSSSTNTNKAQKRSWNVDGATTDMQFLTGDNRQSYAAGTFPGNSQLGIDSNGTQTFYTKLSERMTPAAYSSYSAPSNNDQTMTVSFQDGAAAGGRIHNAIVLSPKGFPAPTLEFVTQQVMGAGKTIPEDCVTYYNAQVTEWNKSDRRMRGLQFEQAAPNTSTQFNWYDADPSKTVKVASSGGALDSRATGNFNSGSGQAEAQNGIF